MAWLPALRRSLATAALTGALALASAGTAAAAGPTVSIKDFAFAPATLTIHVGDSVTWANLEAPASHLPHNASATDKSWSTGVIQPGSTGLVTFATAGTFAYICTIHPDMTGTIVVQAAAPATDTVSPGERGGTGPVGALVILGAAGLFAALLVRQRVERIRG